MTLISDRLLAVSKSPRVSACLAVALLVLTAGCGGSSSAGSGGSENGIQVVASTDVYGDIVHAVAGDHAEVTSFINSAAQDPHSFEATARDQLAVSKADLVVENGGGYDPFIDTLVAAAGTDATVLNAVEISGLYRGQQEFNEHVWYDFAATDKVARAVADQLEKLDPDHRADYERNYETFANKLAELEQHAARLKSSYGGTGVAITEPVPLYLLSAVGLVNETPDEFSEAIEEGTDVSPRVMLETLDLFGASDGPKMLAYNEQTSGPESQRLAKAAEAAGVPVVDFTETLPDGEGYLGWMDDNLDRIGEALG